MDAGQPFDPTSAIPPSTNGHSNRSAGHPSGKERHETGPDVWRYARHDFDRETTRYLSAATQIDLDYAQDVVRNVVSEPLRAVAPAYGVEIAAVARWAVDSVMRRARRDIYLAITMLATVVLLPLMLIWLPAAIIVIAAGLFAAWTIVTLEYWTRAYRIVVGKMLRGMFDIHTAPEPRHQWVRDRINMVSARRRGNLVIFHGESAFVGSGQRLSREHVVIDVSQGKRVKNGKAQKPRKFSNADVHAALMKTMNKLGFNDMRIEERLFVNGRHIRDHLAFLPAGAAAPPASSVSSALLQQAALHPTPDARVYVCVEMPAWQGQLVVTLFVRAVHTGGYLYIEWEYRVLPPIRREFRSIDRRYSRSHRQQLWKSCRWGARRFLPALAKAPLLLISDVRRYRAERKRLSNQVNAIRRGRDFDYGAARSIRELACGFSREHHFLARDEIMYVIMSQQTLLRGLRDFLKKHDVRLGEFDSQAQVILESTTNHYSVHVGDMKDSAVTVGDKSKSKSKSGS
jgi:hypothetical protein